MKPFRYNISDLVSKLLASNNSKPKYPVVSEDSLLNMLSLDDWWQKKFLVKRGIA